jgi:crotonobetainyl-CoA:carnitine CoA-transferase CaiB-like acyl-CoA transferase
LDRLEIGYGHSLCKGYIVKVDVSARSPGPGGQRKHSPLAGIRVLEIGQVISAPYAGLLLADLGADVIKVEPPGVGDSARNPEVTGMGDESATFVTFNRNKKSVVLDLRNGRHYEFFTDLARDADVVLTNMLPTAAARLQIDPPVLRSLNPRLITCSITGFGPEDARSAEPSYDLTHQALAGYMLFEGRPGDPPQRVCIPLADLATAQFAVNAILAALFARSVSGVGDAIEVPMYDSMLSLLTYTATLYLNTGAEPARAGSAHEYTAPWQAVTAQDGDFVVAVRSEKFWHRLCEAIGDPGVAVDPMFDTNSRRLENRIAMTQMLNAHFSTKTVQEWLTTLRAAGVPVAPIRTVAAALDEAVASGSQLIQEIEHQELGRLRVVGNPVRFADMDLAHPRRAPALGEHAADLGLVEPLQDA